MSKSKTICIVGAGTAGAAACALLSTKRPNYNIINIRSATIPTIQVGESTTPLFLKLLSDVGIVKDFYLNTNASPKYGVKFKGFFDKTFYAGWNIMGPINANYAFLYGLTRGEFLGRLDEKVDEQNLILYNEKTDTFPSTIALHIDAQETSNFILDKFKDKITTIYGNVSKLKKEANKLSSVILEDGQEIFADEWIDCTGFSRILIGNDDFQLSNKLPINSALACPVEGNTRVKDRWTVSTAANAGWIWSITLDDRTGTGYVFNDNYISFEEAEEELLSQTIHEEPLKINRFSLKTGFLSKVKKGNVTAVGVSSGFIDPLDATSLQLVSWVLYNWLKYENDTESFNKEWEMAYKTIEKYLSYYYTTCVKSSPFWDSIATMSDEEIYNEFENILSNAKDVTSITGFSYSIVTRLLGFRIRYNPDLHKLITDNIDMFSLLRSTKLVKQNSACYVPYTDELFVKWLESTASIRNEEFVR